MKLRRVEGIDTYNFPEDLLRHPMLKWMGGDYVRFVAVELLRRFRQKDAGAEILSIECEGQPKILPNLDRRTGTVRGVLAEFNLQVLLESSRGKCRRLHGNGKFSVTGLDEPGWESISVGFDIRSSEEEA